MPSVNSSSVEAVEDSSTVMTPSLPTLSKASAMVSPMEGSCADSAATEAISSLDSISRAFSSSRSETAVTAWSMPRFRPEGAAPAATLRRPSLTIAWARTVAVVVPSPAMSLVLVATSLASWAPRFS
jgi:hypothetical protein